LRARVAAAQDATDLDAFISLTRHVFANCYEDLLARCDVPALSVSAIIPYGLDRLRRLIPQLYLGTVVGSGHFLQLEVPDQVNGMLDRFLSVTTG
jgi:pimeloyl-ACP methyl ester carboxylesterase